MDESNQGFLIYLHDRREDLNLQQSMRHKYDLRFTWCVLVFFKYSFEIVSVKKLIITLKNLLSVLRITFEDDSDEMLKKIIEFFVPREER